ncbi:MAG: PP2C family serine/threonine-protein phosphatase [Myxococcota bacterium]
MTLDAWTESITGAWRDGNEDAVLCLPGRGLFVVVDGMGGREAGEVAARLALEAFERVCIGPPCPSLLERAFLSANAAMLAESARSGLTRPMGATASAAWVNVDHPDGEMIVGHVGDTRLFKFDAGGSGCQLSEDHTCEDDAGLPDIVAMRSSRRHLVARALGISARAPGEDAWLQLREATLREGEALLICSDGVGDYVERARLVSLVGAGAAGARETAMSVRDAATAMQAERGAGDNVSVLVVRRLSEWRALPEAHQPSAPLPGHEAAFEPAVDEAVSYAPVTQLPGSSRRRPLLGVLLPLATGALSLLAAAVWLSPHPSKADGDTGGTDRGEAAQEDDALYVPPGADWRIAHDATAWRSVRIGAGARLELFSADWSAPGGELVVYVEESATVLVENTTLRFESLRFELEEAAELRIVGTRLATERGGPVFSAPRGGRVVLLLSHSLVELGDAALAEGWTPGRVLPDWLEIEGGAISTGGAGGARVWRGW